MYRVIKAIVREHIDHTDKIVYNLNSIRMYYEADWSQDDGQVQQTIARATTPRQFDDFKICVRSVQTMLKSVIIG